MNLPKAELQVAGNGNIAWKTGSDAEGYPSCCENFSIAILLKSPLSDIVDLFHITPSAPSANSSL